MNKNLKKVISAVAALALSVSSFTALAANYPDVPADANYKHAVDELTALNIVEGIEENGVLNFKPDEQVTRAQFSTMVVRALDRRNSAESAAGQMTAFTDVNDAGSGAKHWASGYIVILSGQGIINGYGDGTFKPDNTVSYAEAMKMLACAAGYDSWAKSRGGWPQGYLAMANELGIGDGVSVESNDTPLTRAQCAQMVANAIKAPVLVETGETNWDGTRVTEQKNGQGKGYQTILTKELDAYEVYGRVIATSKTASGDMDPDEVRFQVERAENFEDEYFPRNSTPTDFVAKVGDTNAAEQLKVYSEAIIKIDKNSGEYELICLSPLSENAEVKFPAANFDDQNKNYPIVDAETGDRNYENTKLYVMEEGSSRTTTYKLATTDTGELSADIKMYVNGVETDESLDQFIENYIVNNGVGEVTLVSESAVGSTATTGTYNTIMVTSYKDAVVDSVEERGDGYVDIYFIDGEDRVGDAGSLTIDKTDETVDCKVVKSDVEIDPTEIQPYDILSIAYDETVNFSESSFYNIIVSDHDIYEGKYSSYRNRDGEEYQIDGSWYDAANLMPQIGSKTDNRYTTYLFYFDNFGRLAYAEETSTDKNIAIIDNLYQSSDKETWYAKLIYKDGTSGAVALGSSYDTDANLAAIEQILYTTDANGNLTTDKKHPSDRVITYRQNSSKELTNVTAMSNYSTVENGLYRESTKKLGSFTFSDATSVLVISNAPGGGWDLAALDISTLIDDDTYNAYFYDRSSSGVYSFAMVEDSSGTWSRGTQMAAYVATSTTSDENYEYALQLLVPGSDEAVDVFLSEDYEDPNLDDAVAEPYEDKIYTYRALVGGLPDGTPILYTTDASGAITKAMPAMDIMSYNSLKYLPQNTGSLASLAGVTPFTNSDEETASDKVYSMVFGLITMKSGSSVDFVTEITEYTGKDDDGNDVVYNVADTTPETTADHKATDVLKTYTMTDQTAVYVYDYNGRASNNTLITKGAQSAVRATSVPKNAWVDSNSTKINAVYSNLLPRYALARVLGNDIMEIMVFVPENN